MIVVMIATMLQATMPIDTLVQGSDSQIVERREVVVRSANDWQMLWKEHSSGPPPPVDFSNSVAAGVFLGSRPTAGYRVDVVTIRVEGNAVVIEYRERAPAPGALVAQIVTSPFHLVRLPRNVGAIQFRKVEAPVL